MFFYHQVDCFLGIIEVENVVLTLIVRILALVVGLLERVFVCLILQLLNSGMSEPFKLQLPCNCFNSLQVGVFQL